ncbi:FAD-dependent oxidoreductase [Halodesulfurarchaeum sp. HSR-GB]|uniref:FAD-dependent oxidoreductase n=1 Tax=Halodesulfurarchaeum sp. HSR-GB TaxID=3074077 RepID=UPI00285B8DE9|nr:FAD-dependent oxidoreductase [Halodesulfurarchaeum sp. HSR-GB]MDR5657431.1 FAD-dependent oxidoreductase [Halodesulfurarchaeum sp. HSR-GB]
MTDVIVAGGGPAGLGAALYTAKNGLETAVFDTDGTWMHKAHLFNYLGIESVDGTEFMDRSREQVEGFGADLREEEVIAAEETDDGFAVETDAGEYEADYLVLATGTDRSLAKELGCELTDRAVVDVDVTMETSVENVYATGAMGRVEEWQAQIAAGDGVAAALNILSTEEGEKFHDFDTPEDAA